MPYIWDTTDLTFLLFSPVIIIVSWINGFLNNFEGPKSLYENNNYLLSFILPSIVSAYLLSLPFGEKLAKRFRFSFPKILLSFFIALVALILIVHRLSELMGVESKFLTPILIININCGPGCPAGWMEEMRLGLHLAYSISVFLSLFIVALSFIIASMVVSVDKKLMQKKVRKK